MGPGWMLYFCRSSLRNRYNKILYTSAHCRGFDRAACMGVGTGEVTIATGPGFTNFLAGAVIGYECRIGSYTAAMGNNLTIKCAGSWSRASTCSTSTYTPPLGSQIINGMFSKVRSVLFTSVNPPWSAAQVSVCSTHCCWSLSRPTGSVMVAPIS